MENRISLFLGTTALLLTSCGNKTISFTSQKLVHETKFGQIAFDITIEDFNKLGFSFGDSCNVTFSNGKVIEDIPYYNGYYCRNFETLVVGYPGYDSIRVAISNGNDSYEMYEIQDDTTGTITLNKKGKYKDVQDSLSLKYSDDRNEFTSDTVFANFREMNVGNLKDNLLYRSASPCDNQHNRAPYVSKLAEENNISYIIDLADDASELETYNASTNYDISYWKTLYSQNKVLPLDMNMNFMSEKFTSGVNTLFTEFLNNDGAFLIHCTEGKDRTGFVCILFEILAGATYEEIRDDYMVTYANYYNITKETNPVAYEKVLDVHFYNQIHTLEVPSDGEVDKTENINLGCKSYLTQYCGLTSEQIENIKTKLTK